ncbi:MAG TPA: hypothetical protein V6D48_11545, partial [Oculatellaceae cyanobacterium]
ENMTGLTANVYKDGERIRSQFIDNRDGLCGAITFATLLRTQLPFLTGNQIIGDLDAAGVQTNWTGQVNIEAMATHFLWSAIRTTPSGTALTLNGESYTRRDKLLGYIKSNWIPIIGLKTDHGYVERNGTTTHWIGVVGIGVKSNNWFIYIYNPVDDRVKKYQWETFYGYLSREWTSPGDKTKTKYYHNMLVLVKPPAVREPWQISTFMY